MQLGMHTRKQSGKPKARARPPSGPDIEKGAEAARLNRLLACNPGAMLSTRGLSDGTYSESDEKTLTLLAHWRTSRTLKVQRRWGGGGGGREFSV